MAGLEADTDAALVTAVRSGCETAFAALYERHVGAVRLAIGDHVHQREQQADLVQEAFVRFWATREGVADPLAYLYRTLRNVASNTARSQQARELRESSEARDSHSSAQFVCAL